MSLSNIYYILYNNIIFHLFFVFYNQSILFFFSSRRRHTRCSRDWSSDVCSSDLLGFDKNGSFTVSDGAQLIKIEKSLATGSITLQSGKNKVVLGGNPALGRLTVQTDNLITSSLSASIKATTDFKLETLQLSLKGTKLAIGNDVFELFDGLVKLIDALGTLTVTSPVGTCTPLQSAPTWAAQVVPLKMKIAAIKGSLASPDSV